MTRQFRIGRAETNDIVLSDPTVSREHAELTELGRGLFKLRDLNTTYGTAVRHGSDWFLITGEEVRDDSQVRIGEFETTVAALLRSAKGTVMRNAGRAATPPWQAPAPRLSDRARAKHPETSHLTPDQLAAIIAAHGIEKPGARRPAGNAPNHQADVGGNRIALAGFATVVAVSLITIAVALIVYAA